ncbi:MAG: AarF/UbiB family protein, partial [Anaerolineaceae bacterium]|nr:AarF/UbiB family protein [Anaerolineaceae bacterium]
MYKARFRRILFFFGKVTLGVIFWDILLAHLGFRKIARRNRPGRFRRAASHFRVLAIDMGGVMIKVGQFLSTRLDVLPREITEELAGLQDEVTAENFEDIKRELEDSLQAPLLEKYAYFEETPLASASIGQAHRAKIRAKPGDEEDYPPVVVKVQRPNIKKIIETDLSALRIVTGWLNRYPPIRKHANVPALLEELDRSIHEEMDYLQEGKHAEIFAENFRDRTEVLVPRIFWEYTTTRVITLEDVQGIKITDYDAIDAAGIDRAEVAQRLFNTYFQQIFEDHFFHADPHPGNLFVKPEPDTETGDGPKWRLVFVDFGMAGSISDQIVAGLREFVIALSTGDAARAVRADQYLHFLLPGADLDLLERAYARVFESFWGKSTSEMVSMHREEAIAFVREFGQLLYDMPFQMPEDMILLGRCLSILSGMCTGLDKDFNVWTSAGPYARKLVEAEMGKGLDFWLKEILNIITTAATLPKKIENLILQMEQGRLEIRVPELTRKIARQERGQRRLIGAILFAAFFWG